MVRWRDVVAVGRKDDQRIPDTPQVSIAPFANPKKILLNLIANEQVFNDCKDLFSAQEIKPVPPALELKKACLLTVDVGEELGVLLPNGLFWLEILKILRQPGPIKAAIAQVSH